MDRLHEVYRKSNNMHIIRTKEQTKPLLVPCMEQVSGSLDCRVIVCNNMENEIL